MMWSWSLFFTILTLLSSIIVPIIFYGLDCRVRKKEKEERNIKQVQEYLNKIKILPNTFNRINNYPLSYDAIFLAHQQACDLKEILQNSFNTNCFNEMLFCFINILKHLYNIADIDKFNTDDYRQEVIEDIDAKFSTKDIPGVKNLLNNEENILKIKKTSSYIKEHYCESIRTKIKTMVNDPKKIFL